MTFYCNEKRKKYALSARGKPLYEDTNRFGTKMLEKMGWSKGRGLGVNLDGEQNFIKVTHKVDQKGIGFEDRDDHWMQHENEFESLLRSLDNSAAPSDNENEAASDADELNATSFRGFGFTEPDDKPSEKKKKRKTIAENLSGKSLEEMSKNSNTRVHYKKFTRGKDISRYSEKDLANIFGKKLTDEASEQLEREKEAAKLKKAVVPLSNYGITTVETGTTIYDYFQKKKLKRNATVVEENTTSLSNSSNQSDENRQDEPVEPEKKRKKKKNVEPEVVEENTTSLSNSSNQSDENRQDEPVEPEKKRKKKKNVEPEQPEPVTIDEVVEIFDDVEPKKEKKSKKKKQRIIDTDVIELDGDDDDDCVEFVSMEEASGSKKKSKKKKEKREIAESQSEAPIEIDSSPAIKIKKKKSKKRDDDEEEVDKTDSVAAEVTDAPNPIISNIVSTLVSFSNAVPSPTDQQSNAGLTSDGAPLGTTAATIDRFGYETFEINRYQAELFRFVDLEGFSGANLSELDGYGCSKSIDLKITARTQDHNRISDLWDNALISKYGKDVIKSRKQVKYGVKALKNKKLFKAI